MIKLSLEQKSFLTDVAYPKCLDYVSSNFPELNPYEKQSLVIFQNCLESFDLDLIPPCSALIPAFVAYFQKEFKYQSENIVF